MASVPRAPSPSLGLQPRGWRSAAPFVVALALMAYVLARVEWHAFLARLRSVDYPAFVGFMAAFVLALLGADVLATVQVYRRSVGPVRFRDLLVVRGASYLPSLVNHHLGQAWVTYLLSQVYRVPLARVTGATLVVYASWGGCLLLLAVGGLASAGLPLAWTAAPLGLGVCYLVLLAIKPARVAQHRLVAPLFETGVRGHLEAMALRMPHVVVLFLGTWVPFRFFDVAVPFGAALRSVPVIMVAVTLPLTPFGLGTRDALAASFFEQYAVAGNHEQRLSALAAATTTTALTIVLIDVVLGLLLLRPAARLLRAARPPD